MYHMYSLCMKSMVGYVIVETCYFGSTASFEKEK